jgi:hypothetical protein
MTWSHIERIILHHEYDWYCTEDGTFPLLKGDLPGPGFDGVVIVGPYRSMLRACMAYIRKTSSWPTTSCRTRPILRLIEED